MMVDKSYLEKFDFSNIYFEVTSRCNAHCSYCYNSSTSRGKDIPYETILDVMQQAYDINKKTNFVLSGGEPLLHTNIVDIVDFACNHDSEVTLITNGYLLKTMSQHNSLSECNIQVTLDTLDCIQHDNVRGTGSFSNIKNLQNIISNAHNKKRILRVNLTRNNVDQINAMCMFAINSGYTILSFGFLVNQGRGQGNSFVINYDVEDDKKIWAEAIQVIKKCSDQYKNEIIIERKNCYPKMGCELVNFKRPSMALRIAADGNAFPCLYFSEMQHSLGNIYDNSLIEILKGDRLLNLINLLFYREENMESCLGCIWNKQCFKGCPALAFSEHGTFDDKISCSFLKEAFDKAVKSKSEVIRSINSIRSSGG